MSDEQKALSMLKAFTLKDLRMQCRGRGISPAGGKEALLDRLVQNMVDTQDFEIKNVADDGTLIDGGGNTLLAGEGARGGNNNYTRPDGQNCGNFLTDRPSSRVLAPPGGGSNWSMSDAGPVAAGKISSPKAKSLTPWGTSADMPETQSSPKTHSLPKPQSPAALAVSAGVTVEVEVANGESRGKNNNYTRPSGQNVGNFITDKPTSRVLAPPGGGSNICFG